MHRIARHSFHASSDILQECLVCLLVMYCTHSDLHRNTEKQYILHEHVAEECVCIRR